MSHSAGYQRYTARNQLSLKTSNTLEDERSQHRRGRLPLPERDLSGPGRNDVRSEVHVRRPLTVASQLEVVIEHDVREHRLQLVRGEEPAGATAAHS